MDIKYFANQNQFIKYPLDKEVFDKQYQRCLVQDFFENERKAGRNTNVCMISCPCPRCSPMSM